MTELVKPGGFYAMQLFGVLFFFKKKLFSFNFNYHSEVIQKELFNFADQFSCGPSICRSVLRPVFIC